MKELRCVYFLQKNPIYSKLKQLVSKIKKEETRKHNKSASNKSTYNTNK